MNTDLHKAAQQYVGIWQGRLVAHTGIIQFPMKKGKKRVHRFVVLPDYQGVGIGTAFISAIGEIITKQGYELNLTTTTPALVPALTKSPNWILSRYGRAKTTTIGYQKKYGIKIEHLNNTKSDTRITYSFWYKHIESGGKSKLR